MKNMIKLFGISAIIAVIVLGMTACPPPDDGGGKDWEIRNEISTSGLLTITGLSAYIGWEISGYRNVDQEEIGQVSYLVAVGRAGDAYSFGKYIGKGQEPLKITSGQAVLKVFIEEESGGNYNYLNYNRSDQNVEFGVYISNSNDAHVEGKVTVNFTNGVGSAAFQLRSEETLSAAGQLTITGLSDYNDWKISANAYIPIDDDLTMQLYAGDIKQTLSGDTVISQEDVTVTVSSNHAVLKVFINDTDGWPVPYSGYNGSDQNVLFNVYLYNDDDNAFGRVIVNFTNGVAAGNFELYHETPLNTNGRLTITGLSAYNGWKIEVSKDENLVAYESIILSFYGTNLIGQGPITATVNSGEAVLNVYTLNPNNYSYSGYSGSDQNVRFKVDLRDENDDTATGIVNVSFTGGNGGSAVFQLYREEPLSTNGQLTITGLSAYNGWYFDVSPKEETLGFTALYLVIQTYYGDNEDIQIRYVGFHDPVGSDQVVLKVYTRTENVGWDEYVFSDYSGNDQSVEFDVSLWLPEDDYQSANGTVTVNFTNGVASGVFALSDD